LQSRLLLLDPTVHHTIAPRKWRPLSLTSLFSTTQSQVRGYPSSLGSSLTTLPPHWTNSLPPRSPPSSPPTSMNTVSRRLLNLQCSHPAPKPSTPSSCRHSPSQPQTRDPAGGTSRLPRSRPTAWRIKTPRLTRSWQWRARDDRLKLSFADPGSAPTGYI